MDKNAIIDKKLKNIKIIVAVSNNNVIGKDNKLLWKQSDDLKRFKSLTLNKKVIMGRKTFESIGKPLPNRENYVLTKKNIEIPGCYILNDINDVLKLEGEVFVIGGGEIYNQFIDLVDEILITKIDCNIEGDTYFPELDYKKWKITYNESFTKNEINEYNFEFINLKKNG